MDVYDSLTHPPPSARHAETPSGQPAPTAPEPDRPANRGHFRKGHPGPALRHGGRSAIVAGLELPEQAEAREALAARVSEIVADLGGPASMSTLAAGMVERHARLEMVADYLFDNLQRLGPLTAKGRTRAALTAWLTVVDRLQRSATTLGLDRRSKHANPLDAVRAAVVEANR